MVNIADQTPQPPIFLRILNNTFANCGSGGVVVWSAKGGYTQVEGNTFNDVSGAGNFDVIQLGGMIAGTHHGVIRNNFINGGGIDGDPIDTSGHGITHNILIEGNRVIDRSGNLKFHCAVAESTLTPGYDTGFYGPPGSAGWYSPGVSCHVIVRNNIWWSENGTSTFSLGKGAGCMSIWNWNYDSLRTKNNLLKNPGWQEWYGLAYPTLLSEIQTLGNDANNRPETGSVQSSIVGTSAFTNVATNDYSPTAGSPARNIGTALTTVKTVVTNSTTVTVDRATFFFDGYCVANECLGIRDTIRIGTSAPVQVVSVNAITNVLTLSAPVTAAVNAPVSLAIHPIQGIALTGHTPDVGARQYVAAATTPVANYTCSPLSGRVPLNVSCTDSSSNSPTAWAWTFGDTGTSTLQNPTRTYSGAGTYTVGLSATNSAGSNTLTRPAYVKVSQTLFTTQAPANANATDGVPYALGMKFKSTKAGQILAIRYYKAASDTGTHVGKIWSASGTLLTSVTFTGETASGWQEKALATPWSIAANTTYVVSVNVGSHFPITTSAFPPSPSLPLTNGSLSVVNDGANGVFGAPTAFPTSSYQNSNYFRDVVFLPN